MTPKNQVRDRFSATVREWAAAYKEEEPATFIDQNLVSRKNFAFSLLQNVVPTGAKILDVGCGAGIFTVELIQYGYDVLGIDLSEAMIKYARETLECNRFMVGDIEDLKFPNDTFDAITCLGVMEYLDTDEAALQEMWRVLKPGGKAIISTPSSVSPFYQTDRLLLGIMAAVRPLYRLLKYHLRRKPRSIDKDLPQVVRRKYSRRKWLGILRSKGLEPEAWVCHAWGWYSLLSFFNQGSLCRASDLFARNSALNWLGSNQLVRVRALK